METVQTQIKLFEPSAPQRKALKVIYDDMPFVTLLKYGRQTGKSYLMLFDAITRAINNPKTQTRIVVPSYSLGTKHMMTIDSVFTEWKEVKEQIFKNIKYKEQTYILHNGSVIMFLSAEAEDNLRGDTCDFMYIDEAAFIKESTYTEILLPMLTRTGGRLVMVSTPNGKNWFYDLYMQGQDPENKKIVISMEATYLDLKDEDDYESILTVIEALRKSMTTASFNREVMGEFVSDLSLFSNVRTCMKSDVWYEDYFKTTNVRVRGKIITPKKYIGIDIGVVQDYTVMTCIDENDVVVDIERFNMSRDQISQSEFKRMIVNFIKKHDDNLVAAYMEVNNNALLYEELLDDYGMTKLWDVTTTATNKPVMVNQAIKLFDNAKICLPENLQLEKELYAFQAVQNKVTNKWQYKGQEAINDDMVMSLVIAVACKEEESRSGTTMVF